MPSLDLNKLPSLLWATSLYDMVRIRRKANENSTSHEIFTASDVKQALHDFASSSDNASKWLQQRMH
jgi:hypothetical protein